MAHGETVQVVESSSRWFSFIYCDNDDTRIQNQGLRQYRINRAPQLNQQRAPERSYAQRWRCVAAGELSKEEKKKGRRARLRVDRGDSIRAAPCVVFRVAS